MATSSNKTKKIIVSLISTAFFAVLLVWALLSANDRGIDPNNISNPIQFGGIKVNTDVDNRDLTYYIDENEVGIKDNIIRDIRPGTYKLTVEAAGYIPWETEIDVNPGLISEIQPFLFREELNVRRRNQVPMNMDKISYTPTSDFAFFVVSDSPSGSKNGIYKSNLNPSTGFFNDPEVLPVKISNIVPQISDIIEAGNYSLIPSPSGDKLLLKSADGFFIFSSNTETDVVSDNLEPLNIYTLTGFRPQEVFWFKNSDSIVVKSENLLAEVELNTGKTIVITYASNDAPVFSVNGSGVIFFSNLNKTLMLYRDQVSRPITLENRKLPEEISYLDVDKESSRFLVFKSGNSFFYLDIAESFVTEIGKDIKPFSLSPDGRSFLYEKEGKIYSFNVREILPLEEFETESKMILESFDPESMQIKWNSKSTHLIVESKTDEASSVTIIDKSGINRREVLTEEKIVSGTSFMTTDNTEMVLLMYDSAESENIHKDLYSIQLREI